MSFSIDKSSTQYIIDQNEKLNKENRALIKKYSQLESQLEEMEEDVGKAEKVNVHLKAVLKDFHKISENSKKIAKTEERAFDFLMKNIYDFKKEIVFDMIVMNVINFIILFIVFMYCDMYIFSLNGMILIYNIYQSLNTSFKTFKKNNICCSDIKVFKNEIKEIEKTLDYINEYIDTI